MTLLIGRTFRRALLAVLFAAVLVAVVGGGLSGPAAGKSSRTGRFWIVLGSNRSGDSRPYSVRSDGSRLTPLLAHGRGIQAAALSLDGRMIAYTGRRGGSTLIYVSRADGTGLRTVARVGTYYAHPALSRDGKLLAVEDHGRISILAADGQGLRRLATGTNPDWSPDGRTLVFATGSGVVVQELSGARREVVHRGAGGSRPKWSPDGRWIAYLSYRRSHWALNVVQPDGRHRHRVAGGASTFAWSPDGRRLAFGDAGNSEHPRVGIVGVNGRHLRRLRMRISPGLSGELPEIAWSPDGRRLVLAGHEGDDADQIWIVGLDGHGLRRVTSGGTNNLIGWTRFAPVRAPARPLPPAERVVGARKVTTRAPIGALSADGGRVAFVTSATGTDCYHVSVWKPGRRAIQRVSPRLAAPCGEGGYGGMYGVALAGSRVAWAEVLGCGNYCEVVLESATLAARRPQVVGPENSIRAGEGEGFDYHLYGAGNLLVFNYGERLVRIGGGHEACVGGDSSARICTTLRRGAHAGPVDSVSAGLIAIRETDQVAVLDAQGALVRTFPFTPEDVSAARLDSGHLVVARLAFLEKYDVATGAREVSRPLPAGYTLADFDESTGIALLRRPKTIMLLRLADGASFTLKHGHSYLLADLVQRGLYYSYEVGRQGRLAFVPRSQLLRRLR